LKNINLNVNQVLDKSEGAGNKKYIANCSLSKPQNSFKKYSTLKINDNSLKNTQILKEPYSPSLLMQYQKD
jgi:hypothetical protein